MWGSLENKYRERVDHELDSSFDFESDKEKTNRCLIVDIDKIVSHKSVNRSAQIPESLYSSSNDEDESDPSHKKNLIK